jgi:hypothetical protein
MARELVASLVNDLEGSLKQLGQLLPFAPSTTLDALVPAGLPIPDLDRLSAVPAKRRPWWASFFPSLAMRLVRRRLESELGEAFGVCVDSYDRQLQAWAKRETERQIEQFEFEAAPIREHLRRLVGSESGSIDGQSEQERDALTADIQELRRASQSRDVSASVHGSQETKHDGRAPELWTVSVGSCR